MRRLFSALVLAAAAGMAQGQAMPVNPYYDCDAVALWSNTMDPCEYCVARFACDSDQCTGTPSEVNQCLTSLILDMLSCEHENRCDGSWARAAPILVLHGTSEEGAELLAKLSDWGVDDEALVGIWGAM